MLGILLAAVLAAAGCGGGDSSGRRVVRLVDSHGWHAERVRGVRR